MLLWGLSIETMTIYYNLNFKFLFLEQWEKFKLSISCTKTEDWNVLNEKNRSVLGHAHVSLECKIIKKGKIVEFREFFEFLNFQFFLKSKSTNFQLLTTVTKKKNYEKSLMLIKSPRLKCAACQFSLILKISLRNCRKWPKIEDSNFELLFIATTSTNFEKWILPIESSYFKYIVHKFSLISDM